MEQIKKKEILERIKKIAKTKGRNWLSRSEFLSESGITARQLFKHFDCWNNAAAEAGLQILDQRGRPDRTKGYSKEELLNSIRNVASKLNRDYLAMSEFSKETGISWRPIYRLFGNWEQAVIEADLKIHPSHKIKIQDVELFKEYFKIKNELNRFPSYNEFARRSRYSIGVYDHRFGNFTEFRKHALQYGIDNGLIKPDITQTISQNVQTNVTQKEPSYEILADRPVLGERIDFRSLLHAPINELGVVYLFGILSDDLGFIVESIQSGFPDCEAKRRLKGNRWQKVRIEFEYKSSNFVQHQHDITQCDIIICWKHDWNDCPLEVIALKDFLKNIKK